MTVHVYPLNDWIDHDIESDASDCNCVCDPSIRWSDEESGELFEEPLVIHNLVRTDT
jgi:hypothetical protein